ncbi:GMC family oxidoreductase N-terminal domain-containing protein [Microbacterium kribbense]|uniref:GMC family oxidoreductase N-terminal domain-containing protein n=1 Tax=Microbacterium kribbense TaxID=433645 RepID=A0ABP7GHC9_9MICO
MPRVVIIGAGGSGIPLAARLGEAGHDVVLLESGPASPGAGGEAWTVHGGLPDGPLTWTYRAELWPGKPWRIARGRVLGGSMAVNGAYFQRPHPDDFAAWAAVAGDEWSYAACLPALRRLESDLDFPDSPVHGWAGPMPVRRSGARERLTQAFLAAAGAAGAIIEADKNAGGASGAGLLPRNALGVQRWGVDRAYWGLLRTAGVEIRAGVHVHTVRFRGGAAIGVEIDHGTAAEFVPADEVILTAGAIETPRLLLRSGIGDSGRRDSSVQPVSARRGVGRNLSDHVAVDVPWRVRPDVAVDDLPAAWTAAWNAPAGTVASHAIELLFAALPSSVIESGDRSAGGAHKLRVTLADPSSRGSIGLDRGTVVRYGYLSDAGEREALRDGIRVAARVLRASEMADVVAAADLPDWIDGRGPTEPASAHVSTALHSCGTARMGDVADADAVADAHGRVYGTSGLRIADASLLPMVPSRGTALTAVMIGERIAELIAQE